MNNSGEKAERKKKDGFSISMIEVVGGKVVKYPIRIRSISDSEKEEIKKNEQQYITN